MIITSCCKCRANIAQIFPTLHKKNPGTTLNKRTRLYGTIPPLWSCTYIQIVIFLIHYLQYINLSQYLHYLQLVFSFLKISFFFRSLCSLLNSANLPHSGLFTVVAFPGYNSIFAFLNQFCLSYPDFYGIYLYGILRGSQP